MGLFPNSDNQCNTRPWSKDLAHFFSILALFLPGLREPLHLLVVTSAGQQSS